MAVRISKGFIKSSLVYTLAGMLPMASAIILLPFYLKYLPGEQYGALAIYLVFSLLIQILTTFSFDASIYVHFHEYRKDPATFARFVSSAFNVMLLIGAGLTLVLLFPGDWIFRQVFKNPYMVFFPYGLIAIVTGVFNAFFKVFSSLLQSRQRPELYLRSNVLSFSIIALLTVVGLQYYPESLLGPLGARMVAAIVSGGWSLFRIYREYGVKFDVPLLRSSFSFNFYAFIYQLQQWSINSFDRILLSLFIPLESVGVYDIAMKCLLAIEFVISGLQNSFLPKIVGMVMEQPEKKATPEINRYYYALTAVLMLLVVGAVFSYPLILGALVHKPDYLLAIPLIPFAALFYLFRGMRLYFNVPYGILKYTKPLPAIYLVVSVVRIGVMLITIPLWGAYGAVVSAFVSAGLEVLLVYAQGRKKFDFRFNSFKLIFAPVLLMVFMLALELTLGRYYPLYAHALQAVVAVLLIVLAFRNELKYIRPSIPSIR
jgi:O-antigen/teichoic acid export membrane protein